MTAEKITPAAVYDAIPNFNLMVKVVTATSDSTDDWVDMADYGFTTIYAAQMFDVSDNSYEICSISGTTVVMTGTVGENRIVVYGV